MIEDNITETLMNTKMMNEDVPLNSNSSNFNSGLMFNDNTNPSP